MGQSPSQPDSLGTEFYCPLRKAKQCQANRPDALGAHSGIMTTEGEREGMMMRAVVS
jgi:hypothetical protein